MKKLRIAWDVDDTLIVPSVVTGNRDVPNYETIAIYKWFQAQGYHMIIWSGSGVDWARTWAEKLGLTADEFPRKGEVKADLCFDDCEVDLAKVNVRVKRVQNSISRKEWNEAKRLEEGVKVLIHGDEDKITEAPMYDIKDVI